MIKREYREAALTVSKLSARDFGQGSRTDRIVGEEAMMWLFDVLGNVMHENETLYDFLDRIKQELGLG